MTRDPQERRIVYFHLPAAGRVEEAVRLLSKAGFFVIAQAIDFEVDAAHGVLAHGGDPRAEFIVFDLGKQSLAEAEKMLSHKPSAPFKARLIVMADDPKKEPPREDILYSTFSDLLEAVKPHRHGRRGSSGT